MSVLTVGWHTLRMAMEEDLREIDELKHKLGGNWRDEMAEDGWLDLFDAMDSTGPLILFSFLSIFCSP